MAGRLKEALASIPTNLAAAIGTWADPSRLVALGAIQGALGSGRAAFAALWTTTLAYVTATAFHQTADRGREPLHAASWIGTIARSSGTAGLCRDQVLMRWDAFMISELAAFLRQHRRASLRALAYRFESDPEALRGMLERLERKGRVRRLPQVAACSSCCQCDPLSLELYEWQDGSGPV